MIVSGIKLCLFLRVTVLNVHRKSKSKGISGGYKTTWSFFTRNLSSVGLALSGSHFLKIYSTGMSLVSVTNSFSKRVRSFELLIAPGASLEHDAFSLPIIIFSVITLELDFLQLNLLYF